jgi:hypothetical protein
VDTLTPQQFGGEAGLMPGGGLHYNVALAI